ncbi:DUF3048 domain-containing protein [Bacillus methanolicus]|uniref:DUF3048 domain-containing protein n=1 Tax=Bacillus methanolicus TaxID=1471 RepID=UPI0023804A71|nr:DUF3048 domain-containing protein [Bacillus methanolicus]MDE3840807.1 DUF3048 domain-containing protein [Bacillus methanolicus]
MVKKWVVAGSIMLLLLTGCNKQEKAEVAGEKESDEVVQEEKTDTEFSYQFPLTGIGTEEQSTRRAIAVVINNHPAARPQSGLQKADIVYEVLAEGDVTRLLAVFQSEMPDQIGPVRSARDYLIELAKGFNSLFIAHGYSPEAKKMLEQGYIDNLNGMTYDGTLFKRADFRKAPHNSYISFANITKGAELNNYELMESPDPLKFYQKEELDQITGKQASSVMISYFSNDLFNVSYEYDPEIEKYRRYTNEEQTVDYESKEPVRVDNILILEMEHKVVDNYGRRDINLTSGGKGYLLQKGKWNEVEWRNEDGKIVPYFNGKEASFVPGKTWVNVIPSDPGLTESVSFESN